MNNNEPTQDLEDEITDAEQEQIEVEESQSEGIATQEDLERRARMGAILLEHIAARQNREAIKRETAKLSPKQHERGSVVLLRAFIPILNVEFKNDYNKVLLALNTLYGLCKDMCPTQQDKLQVRERIRSLDDETVKERLDDLGKHNIVFITSLQQTQLALQSAAAKPYQFSTNTDTRLACNTPTPDATALYRQILSDARIFNERHNRGEALVAKQSIYLNSEEFFEGLKKDDEIAHMVTTYTPPGEIKDPYEMARLLDNLDTAGPSSGGTRTFDEMARLLDRAQNSIENPAIAGPSSSGAGNFSDTLHNATEVAQNMPNETPQARYKEWQKEGQSPTPGSETQHKRSRNL